MTFSVLGGLDDNLSPQVGGGGGALIGGGRVLTSRPSGYVGYADTYMRYFVGKAARSLDVSGRGYLNTYSNVGVGPGYGGDMTATAQARLGQRTGLAVSQNSMRAPYYAMGLFGEMSDIGGTNPDSVLTSALLQGTSWTHRSSASATHELTRRWRTSGYYAYVQRSQTSTADFTNQSHSGGVTFDRSIGRASGVRTSYTRSDNSLLQAGIAGNILTDTVTAGFTYSRQLSRSRNLSLSAGGGAQHVDRRDAVRQKYWSPSSYASGRIDVGRSWSVNGDYRQSLNVLTVPVLSSNYFLTQSVIVGAGGYVGNVQLTFNGGYANGNASRVVTTANNSRYSSYTATAQALFPFTRWWSGNVSFNHYLSRLSGQTGLSPAPSRLERNVLQVGFVLDLPLFGYFTGAAPRGGRRN